VGFGRLNAVAALILISKALAVFKKGGPAIE